MTGYWVLWELIELVRSGCLRPKRLAPCFYRPTPYTSEPGRSLVQRLEALEPHPPPHLARIVPHKVSHHHGCARVHAPLDPAV